jgi:N-acyl-D-amino-acid deacylase
MAHFDTIIRGGTVIDGTRLPRYRADLALAGGRIARIGGLRGASAERVLEADGLVVAPGAVDLHTHYDAQIHWDPWCSISSWHGVTSVVLGNCGFGFAPVREEERDRAMLTMTRNEAIPLESMRAGMDWDWVTFPDWMDKLERIPKGVNCVQYTPLAPLMTWVMGLEAAKSRRATDDEVQDMQGLLSMALDHGACGFSYQRLGPYSPQADFDGSPMVTDVMSDSEVLAFAEVLRERDEGMIQLTDGAGREFVEKLAEVSGRPILYNVVFALGDDPSMHRDAISWLADCNARGLRIFGQGFTLRAPASFSLDRWSLWDSAPSWNQALNAPGEARLRLLADPAHRARMIEEVDNGALITMTISGPVPELMVVGVDRRPELQHYLGRTLEAIGAEEGKHPVEVLLDLSLATDLRAEVAGDTTKAPAEFTAELLGSPYVIAGVSDGGAHTKFVTNGAYPTDMLEWLVREHGVLTAEEAHYRLSYLPAHAAGFRDRGVLREGAPADLIVYDPETVRRLPNWWDSEIVEDLPGGEWRRVQRAEGYHWTFVNGEVTFELGTCTAATPGRLLRHGRG